MPESDLPVAPAARDDIRDENLTGWSQVEASDYEERLKTAIYFVACGTHSYRSAARTVGYEDHASVYRACRRFDISSANTTRLMGQARRIAEMGMEQLEDRLADNPEKFSVKELGVTSGIMLDKIAKKERWGLSDDESSRRESPFEQLARAAAEGKISMAITVRPPPTRPGEETDGS